MVPHWIATSDLIAVPHRGLWGRPLSRGAAENTLAAAQAAFDAGYRVMEFDASVLDPEKLINNEFFIGRYSTSIATGERTKKRLADHSNDELQKLYMRTRDQAVSHEAGNRLLLGDDLLKWAMERQVLLIIDPNAGGDQVFAAVLNRAYIMGGLANIVLKVNTSGGGNYAKRLKFSVGSRTNYPFRAYEGQFLWIPVVNETPTLDKMGAEIGLASWHRETNQSKEVLAYLINLYSHDHWSTEHYSASLTPEPGPTWKNLIDRIGNLTPEGKRAAIWSRDAMGDKGRLGTQYTWNFITNSATDTRGNPYRNLSYDFSEHLMVITDRPEWYEEILSGDPR